MAAPNPSGAKPAAKKPAPRAAPKKRVSREEARKAVEEIKAPSKHAVFRDIKLVLPPVLPASFAFDSIEIEATGGMHLGDIRRLIVGILGEQQWATVRQKIADDGDPMDNLATIMEELLEAVFAPYGMTLGESSASATS